MSGQRGPIPACDQATVEQMVQMRATGAIYRVIGEHFGVSARTAQRYVTGVTKPAPLVPPEHDDLAYTGGWRLDGLILRPAEAS